MYGKVFQQIFESTINELELYVRYVWIALLVICDRCGVVDMTPESIARRINISVDQVNRAIEELCKPDSRSRSSEEAGRRLVPIRSTYGWRIVNYSKYRAIQREEDRRGYQRDLMRKRRATDKGVFPAGSIELELSELLFSLLQRRNPKHKRPDLQKWAHVVGLMIRRDGRDPVEIRRLIEWSQADDLPSAKGFCWANIILSPAQLREQFDQLVLKSKPRSRGAAPVPALVPLGDQSS